MAKKKEVQAPATVSPTPVVPIVISPEANQILEQILQRQDQTPAEPPIAPQTSPEPEAIQTSQELIQPIADQTPVEQLITPQTSPEPEATQASHQQIQTTDSNESLSETIFQLHPQLEEEPEKKLTFEEKVLLRARYRNGKRMGKIFADIITGIVNPLEKDDNPDRA